MRLPMAILVCATVATIPCRAGLAQTSPHLGAGAISRAIQLLGDGSPKVRLQAAVTLGVLADRRGIPALIDALRDPHDMVRAVVSAALGRACDARALVALTELMADEGHALVRRQAQRARRSCRDSRRRDGARPPGSISSPAS